MSKMYLLTKAVTLRDAGHLFDPADAEMQDIFASSIDRFCDITLVLQGFTRVRNAEPILQAGRSFYAARHNREFTRTELHTLLKLAGFRRIEVAFLRSRRYRCGIARMQGLASALRDAWPSLRKSLIAFAEK